MKAFTCFPKPWARKELALQSHHLVSSSVQWGILDSTLPKDMFRANGSLNQVHWIRTRLPSPTDLLLKPIVTHLMFDFPQKPFWTRSHIHSFLSFPFLLLIAREAWPPLSSYKEVQLTTSNCKSLSNPKYPIPREPNRAGKDLKQSASVDRVKKVIFLSLGLASLALLSSWRDVSQFFLQASLNGQAIAWQHLFARNSRYRYTWRHSVEESYHLQWQILKSEQNWLNWWQKTKISLPHWQMKLIAQMKAMSQLELALSSTSWEGLESRVLQWGKERWRLADGKATPFPDLLLKELK